MRDMPLPFEAEAKGGVGFLHKFCRDFSQEISGGVGGGGGGGYGGFVGGGDWGKFEAYFGGGGSGVVCDPEAAKRSPSPSSASTSTLSSSLAGGGGSTDTAAVATFSGNPSEKWPQGHPQNQQQETSTGNSSGGGGGNNVESSGNNNCGGGGGGCVNLELFQQMPANLDVVVGGGAEKCGGMEYWDPDLLEPVAGSPGQDQSIMRLIMGGDVEDPSMGLNKLLQQGSGVPPDLQFAGGAFLGLVDQGFGLDPGNNNNNNKLLGSNNLFPVSNPSMLGNLRGGLTQNTSMFGSPGNNSSFPIALPIGVGGQLNPHAHMFEDCPDEKSHVLNHPQLLISQLQAQNPAFFMPLQHNNNQLDQYQQHHHHQLPLAPPPKRHNPGVGPKPGGQFPLASCPQQLHLLPYMQQQQQQRPAMMSVTTKPPKMVAGDETMIQQQAIVDQLHKAAEHIELGNHILAQEILARLNHHLSPIGKPFYRAAFYFKEALRLLLMNNNNNNNSTASTITPTTLTTSSSPSSPFNLFFKIQAYKSFSEISPLIQFSNFTCNQAVLESLEGFDHIRIVDFDIGYGGQWASLMQELALRKGGAPAIKITAFASPATHDQLELSLTRENLVHFAQEINMSFEFEIINVDCLNSSTSWPLPYRGGPEPDAIAVNLPVSILSNNLVSPTMILRFIKQLAPKIVVSVDRGCDRTDLPFVHQIHQAFQSYLALLESLDAVNVSLDALQKIETFLIRPGIEKLILGRHSSPEKTQHWKTQFLAAGFSPLNFSNFTECQAEWLLKRTLARGFHVEKRQSSLVLYFQRKELISASAWRCC